MRTSILLCLGSLLLLACGSDADGTLLGATCERSEHCGPEGICITSGDEGLCSFACQVSGRPGQCPLGAYCDHEKVKTDFGDGDMTLCFPACDRSDDCRPGYKCGGVSGGPGNVCHPK